jgi:phosphohistidine phosphatase
MKTLILMRHAKAVREHEAPSDRERRLTVCGRRDAEAAGAALRAEGLHPDLALVSAAARTRETAFHALAGIAPLTQQVEETLYLASPDAIWDAAAASGGEAVLVIGHNPGLQELAAELIAQAHDHSRAALETREHFPTAAFAAFEVSGDTRTAAGARLIAAWRPQRGGSED